MAVGAHEEVDAGLRIQVQGLRKSFDGKAVLRGVDLDVRRGESLVILGPSGVGKSVLLKHMIGLIRPDQGRVLIDGVDMTRADARRWREVQRMFGFAFQEGALFDSMDVFENIAFPLRRHTRWDGARIRERVRECLALVQLEGVEAKAPNQLSGGMRRRVGFARAIALQPEILLFDEPVTGLDPVTAAVIDRVIVMMRERLQATLVIITHDTKSAFRIGDRIAMLQDGRIAALAPPDEFQRHPDPYIQRFLAGEPLEEEAP
jgi:phospholipid/cholesterol/gamma-HCH transport system ATP-binding protein